MPFTIESLLNESSSTRVYRAFDEALHRPVLLKVLHKHLASEPQVHERFVREARACAALRSEHIVQVYGLTEVDASPAIVMEYVEGKSLKEYIEDESNRTFAVARKVAEHVLRGLSAAHARGIIHRDIKPGNILVADNGSIRVTDFGLARFTAAPNVTTEGALVGTPAYLPPELVRGERPDERSDLFSLGATLVEVVSGVRLFEGTTYAECLNKINAFDVESLDKFLPQSDPEFFEFVKRLMHPDKRQRFASAKDALNALVNGDSDGEARIDGSRKRKRSLVLAVGAMVVVAISAALLFYDTKFFTAKPNFDDTNGLSTLSDTMSSSSSVAGDSSEISQILPDHAQSREVESRTGGAVTPASAETPHAKDSAAVSITSTPWAKVYIDNMLVGETPFEHPVYLPAGAHTVVFTHPSFEPVLKTVIVSGRNPVQVDCNFLELAGYLFCSVKPWADIYVDEIFRGTTPLEKPIMLSAGMHRVRFYNPSFQDIRRDITVALSDTVKLSISFVE